MSRSVSDITELTSAWQHNVKDY